MRSLTREKARWLRRRKDEVCVVVRFISWLSVLSLSFALCSFRLRWSANSKYPTPGLTTQSGSGSSAPICGPGAPYTNQRFLIVESSSPTLKLRTAIRTLRTPPIDSSRSDIREWHADTLPIAGHKTRTSTWYNRTNRDFRRDKFCGLSVAGYNMILKYERLLGVSWMAQIFFTRSSLSCSSDPQCPLPCWEYSFA